QRVEKSGAWLSRAQCHIDEARIVATIWKDGRRWERSVYHENGLGYVAVYVARTSCPSLERDRNDLQRCGDTNRLGIDLRGRISGGRHRAVEGVVDRCAGGRRLEGDQRRRVEFTTIRRDGRLCCRIKVLVVVEGAIVETPTGGILHMHVHDVAAGIIGQPGNGRWHRDLNVGIADD